MSTIPPTIADRAASPSPDTEPILCTHCGLIVPPGRIIADAEQQFCCAGCAGVYRMIHACDLGQYYRLRDAVGRKKLAAASPLTDETPRYAALDQSEFIDKHAILLAEGLRQIDLRLSNVQCAACAWLVERLPKVCAGVLESRLSLSQMTARITWDPEQTPLSTIAETLHRLGYPVHPSGEVDARALRIEQERQMLVRIGVAGVCAGNAMLLAVSLYLGLLEGMAEEFTNFLRWVSLLFGGVAVGWPGFIFFRNAWANLRGRMVSLDTPIALALGVGVVAGTINVVFGRGEIYFDSLCVLVFLLLVGRYLQMRQQRLAIDAVSLMQSLTPVSCEVWRNQQWMHLPIDAVVPGDRVRVPSNQRLPVDGTVCKGESSLDTSSLTGESRPQNIGPGDGVFAGGHNVGPAIEVLVLAAGSSTRLNRLMADAVADVSAKPRMVRFTDRVAGVFTFVLIGIALLVFTGWWAATGLPTALDHTVALLIVACPCALGLATPLTYALAVGAAARRDILVKDPTVFEKLSAIDPKHTMELALDKTGTLTKGEPTVIHWEGDVNWQSIVGAMERDSKHPVGRALATQYDVGQLLDHPVVEDPTGGVSTTIYGQSIHVGSPRWLCEQRAILSIEQLTSAQQAIDRPETVVGIAVDDQLVAAVWLSDTPHADSEQWISHLQAEGFRANILSGDQTRATLSVANAVGLSPQRVHAELSPEDKAQWVKQKQSNRKPTMMVGDGVNDAAALARADVGVAVKGGAQAALSVADVYTHRDGLQPLVELMNLSRVTARAVRQNLAISLGYNSLTVGLAAAGLLNPWIAAILMPLSSLTVLGMAVSRLGRWKGLA